MRRRWSLIVERVCISGAVPAILQLHAPGARKVRRTPDARHHYFITEWRAQPPEALIQDLCRKNIEVVQGTRSPNHCGSGTCCSARRAAQSRLGRTPPCSTDVAVRGDDGVIREHGGKS